MQNKQKLIIIIGSTASGKSDLAIFLAKKIPLLGTPGVPSSNDAEIISADSRQVYKWMDIGTGKVTKKETRGIPHHLLDVAHPSRQFTVIQYKKLAEKAINKIQKKNKISIIVGGTGFYIDAVVYNMKFPKVRANLKLRKELEKLNTEELFKRLKKLGPKRAKNIDAKNKRRLIRAIEIAMALGRVPPETNSKRLVMRDKILIIGITMSKEKLHARIEKRLYARLKHGMIAEVKRLHEKYKVSWKRLENFGLEYKWIALFLQNKISREEMEKNLLRDIKYYAKRQMTWFKRNPNIHWIKNKKDALRLVKKFLNV